MRILLINHPGLNDNPGSQVNLDGLVRTLRSGGADHIDILPDEFIRRIMFPPVAPHKNRLSIKNVKKSLALKFPAGVGAIASIIRYWKLRILSRANDNIKNSVNIPAKQSRNVDRQLMDRWQGTVKRILTREQPLADFIKRADRIVINGGGTLHHNRPAALSLFAIARAAQIMGKDVHVVNSTIQAMHPEILKSALGRSGHVAVREVKTYGYLKSLGLECKLNADYICAADFHPEIRKFPLPEGIGENPCIITGGVINVRERILPMVKTLRGAGYSPFYFMACHDDTRNNWLIGACRGANLPIVLYSAIPPRYILTFLKQVRLVVSGRYHINMLSLLAGVPFIPLSSNSWKIEGMRELFDWPIPVLSGEGGLKEVLSSFPEYRPKMDRAFEKIRKTVC